MGLVVYHILSRLSMIDILKCIKFYVKKKQLKN